jgi:hypothetical protein
VQHVSPITQFRTCHCNSFPSHPSNVPFPDRYTLFRIRPYSPLKLYKSQATLSSIPHSLPPLLSSPPSRTPHYRVLCHHYPASLRMRSRRRVTFLDVPGIGKSPANFIFFDDLPLQSHQVSHHHLRRARDMLRFRRSGKLW